MPNDSRQTRTILVIDDEHPLRLLAEAMLLDLGYSVLLAATGSAGVQLLRQNSTAVTAVLLDMSMPGIGPVETFRCLREICPAIPVIIISGHSEDVVRRDFPPGTIAGSIQKPYTDIDLDAALMKALVPEFPKSRPPLKLERLSDSDREEFAQQFLTARKLEMPRMAELLASSDFHSLILVGHSLKGSGTCFGFPEITRLGGALERSALDCNADSCGKQLASLKDYLAHVSPD